MSDPTEIRADEFHPAARQAYRWLKGFMITNADDYLRYKDAMQIAAASGNRQAEICLGTIERLRLSQPVSDRYLMGLAWTILFLHNPETAIVEEARLDRAYPKDRSEFTPREYEATRDSQQKSSKEPPKLQ